MSRMIELWLMFAVILGINIILFRQVFISDIIFSFVNYFQKIRNILALNFIINFFLDFLISCFMLLASECRRISDVCICRLPAFKHIVFLTGPNQIPKTLTFQLKTGKIDKIQEFESGVH